MESKKFLKLLEIILAIGNFLNSSGGRGAHGFNLSSLLKLKDVKATGAPMDLLTYIVLFLQKNYPDIVDFYKELEHVEPASRVAISQVQSDISEMKKGVSRVAQEIEALEQSNPSPKDKFRSVMIEFLDYASDKVDKLEAEYEKAQELLQKLQVFYGEDKKKYKPEAFLQTASTFIVDFKSAIDTLQRKKEAEEKKAKKEAKKAEKLQNMAKKAKSGKSKVKSIKSEGLLDDLQNDLLSGAAFSKKKKKKKGEIDVEDLLARMNKRNKEKKERKEAAAKKAVENELTTGDLDL